MVASALPSRGPRGGRKCYVTPAFWGGANAKCGEKFRSGYLTPVFSGAQKRAEVLRNPCILEVPNSEKFKSGYLTPAFSGVPNAKCGNEIRSGYLTPALLRGPEEGGTATQPLRSRGSPTPSAGRNSEVATSPLPSPGPTRGRKCYVTPAFSGAKRWEKIRSGCRSPAFSGAQKRAEVLRNPYILEVPNREKFKSGYLTTAFSGVPNDKCGNKIRSGYLTPALLRGPQEGGTATQPLRSRGSQRQAQGEIQKWLPHPCILRGPQEGGSAT